MELILIGAGVVIGAAVVAAADRFEMRAADYQRLKARQELELARELLDTAEHQAIAARALTTPTAEHQTIPPPLTVRVGQKLADIRDWARSAGPDTSPEWKPGEIKQLAEKPPLRIKALPARSRRWLQPKTSSSTPTPELLARLPYDPTRILRTKVVTH